MCGGTGVMGQGLRETWWPGARHCQHPGNQCNPPSPESPLGKVVTENGHKLVDMVNGITKAMEPMEDPISSVREELCVVS